MLKQQHNTLTKVRKVKS